MKMNDTLFIGVNALLVLSMIIVSLLNGRNKYAKGFEAGKIYGSQITILKIDSIMKSDTIKYNDSVRSVLLKTYFNK